MKVLTIAYYTIKRNFRDRKSISLTLLFPIMLILILGTALNSAYSPKKISKINVAYKSEDPGAFSNNFMAFLKSKDIKGLLQIKDVKTYDAGIKLVNAKDASALIYIPKNYSEDVYNDKKAFVQVYQSEDNALNSTIVKNIVDSFINGAKTIGVLNKMGVSNPSYGVYKNIVDKPITTTGTIPRAIDYYAVTMLALTLMYGALYGSFGMAEDKTEKTYIRIKSSPTKPYINYIGKTLGAIVTLILQMVILVLFTKYAFHANWGPNMGMIFFLGTLFSVFAVSLGIMAYAVTNDAMRASGIINILVVFFTFISGGYAKLNADGTWFEKFSYISPNKLFQTATFNNIYGGAGSQTQLCILALIGLTVIMFIIASVAGRRSFN